MLRVGRSLVCNAENTGDPKSSIGQKFVISVLGKTKPKGFHKGGMMPYQLEAELETAKLENLEWYQDAGRSLIERVKLIQSQRESLIKVTEDFSPAALEKSMRFCDLRIKSIKEAMRLVDQEFENETLYLEAIETLDQNVEHC